MMLFACLYCAVLGAFSAAMWWKVAHLPKVQLRDHKGRFVRKSVFDRLIKDPIVKERIGRG